MLDVILTYRWGLQDLDVIECGTEKCLPNYSYGPAVRDFYILLLKLFSFLIDEAPDNTIVLEETTIKESYVKTAIEFIQINYAKK